jgi:hypothetical protein
MSLQISIFKCQLVKHPHGIEVDEYGVGICFPDMRGERREREREKAHGSKCLGLPSPNPLGSIYRGGGEDCLHFIPLMR